MPVIINRVYTRTGDAGTTRLAGGQEVAKTDPRIVAYGTLDELNACLGLVVEEAKRSGLGELERLRSRIFRIQNEIFDLGSELAVLPEDRHEKQPLIGERDVERLELEMDEANQVLPSLRSFILPGGGMISAGCHLARTVCRRGERGLVALHQQEPQRPVVLQYVNRLSDWLFVMGRYAAVVGGDTEVLWRPGER
ncbi:MAG: cob(I)yrinic acid a,c-diamide adenosyltransferase [Myxococcales bacterium]|nr:cob(I)yrinic acid a,c-diamide adenosyltransferase [Myxococcales bacterium]